jgi:hypothetical protein
MRGRGTALNGGVCVATIEIDLVGGDAPSPLSLPTGQVHSIVLKRPILQLKHLYHDDGPVQGAAFTVQLANGRQLQGTLDENGEASVPLPARATKVRFGPDARPWRRKDEAKNPDFLAEFEAEDADAFVAARFATGAEQS